MLTALTIYFYVLSALMLLSIALWFIKGDDMAAETNEGGANLILTVLMTIPGLHLELVAAHDLGIPAWVIWGGTVGGAVMLTLATAREWPRGAPSVGAVLLSIWLMWHGLQVLGR